MKEYKQYVNCLQRILGWYSRKLRKNLKKVNKKVNKETIKKRALRKAPKKRKI